MRSLTLILILAVTASAFPAQPDLSLALPGYRVSLKGALTETAGGGFVVAKLDSLSRARRTARFGVLLPSSADRAVLEFLDGTTGAILATVSADQWNGMESAGWKRIPGRSSVSSDRIVEAFALRNGSTSLTFIRTFERISAPYLPVGSGLRLTMSVARASVPSVRVVLHGSLEGVAVVNGRLLTVASAEKQVPLNATLLLVWSEGSTLRLEGVPSSRSFTVRGAAVSAASADDATALQVTVAGTTSPVAEHQASQASSLLGTIQGQTPRPLLMARTLVDRPKAAPGDTMTVRLTYYNVGTSPATDVELSNPVPDGTVYVDGSAAGMNSELREERAKAVAPAIGPVQQLFWKFRGAMAPGESRWASFRVVVR